MRPNDKLSVAQLHRMLDQAAEISDDEILAALSGVSVTTNAMQVAFVMMGIIAPICAYRENLTPQLLPHVLHPLVAMGVESGEQVIGWIEYHLRQLKPFDISGAKPVAWIETLTTQPELIQTLLDQAMRENDRDIMDEAVDHYSLHIRIPLDQVDFHFNWSEVRLSRILNGIFVFELIDGDDEESERFGQARMAEIITTITSTLAESKTDSAIRLVLFDTQGHHSFQYRYDRITSFIPNVDKESVQVLWLHNNKVIHALSRDQIEPSIINQNTLDLVTRVASMK